MTLLTIGSTEDGADFGLPTDALTTMTAILGRRGSGKTTTALDLAEEFIAAGLPVVLLDPLGVHWGLRSGTDGQTAGLSVTIFGGAHGDLPLEETAGKLIAEVVVEHPGAYIIDFSAFESRAAEKRFAADFAERLYRLKAKSPSALGLIVDEADTFAPQNAKGEERMLGAFEAIARRGRVRGLGMVAITQRPAVLNKNVLSQCELMIAHQVTAPQDREALKAWAQGNASPEQVTTFIDSLAGLKVGEAWVWSPAWLEVFARVRMRQRRTFDSSATPKAGETRIEPRVLAAVDLEALRSRMAETIEKTAADDPKKLRAEIARLQAIVDKPSCDHEKELAELRAYVDRISEENDVIRAESASLYGRIERAQEALADPAPAAAESRPIPSRQGIRPELPAPVPVPPRADRESAKETVVAEQRKPSGAGLNAPKQAIIDALGAFVPIGIFNLSRSIVAAYAKVSPNSSGFEKNLGSLRSDGLVEYPAKGDVRLTEDGLRAVSDDFEKIKNVGQLHDRWLGLLNPPRAAIVRLLLATYPLPLTREEIAAQNGVSPSSSGFEKNLGGLRTLGLIEYPSPGLVVATKLLFPEGLS